jgi:hypothetical protein
MSILVVWYGLPGSGKSAQLRPLAEAGYRTFDDFMQDPLRLRSGIASSRHFDQIVDALREAIPCAIADIQLCRQVFRDEMRGTLAARVPALVLQWHCFDCRSAESVAICRDNVRFRAEASDRDPRHALDWIDRNASAFSIEPGAWSYPVVHARRAGNLAARTATPSS